MGHITIGDFAKILVGVDTRTGQKQQNFEVQWSGSWGVRNRLTESTPVNHRISLTASFCLWILPLFVY